MNMLLWGAFYLVASLFLLFFFFKEKQVIHWIRTKEDEILQKISLGKNQKSVMVGNLLTVVALIVSAVFFVIVDKSEDPNIWIKVWGIYAVFGLNVVFYVLRIQHEWIFLLMVVKRSLKR